MRFKYPTVFLSMLLCMALVLISHIPLYASIFTWGGTPILGEAGEEYPNFFPEGSANFVIAGNSLTLTLTYTGSSDPLSSVNQVLTGLTWDLVDGFAGTLTPVSALIPVGSYLILDPIGTFSGGDLSGQWAYKDDITAISGLNGPLGPYGVGAVGDINFGEDTFGVHDIINSGSTQYTPAPNGVDFGLVPDASLPSKGGFQNQGPFVQDTIVFGFDIVGDGLSEDMFTNVMPLFGSEGAPIPEPATLLLLGSGFLVVVLLGRKRARTKA